VTAERTEVTRSTTQAVASERDAIAAAWNASLQSQRRALVSDMETASSRAVNRISVLAGLLVALGVLMTAVAVLLVRRPSARAKAGGGGGGGGASGGAYQPLRGYVVETGRTGDEIRITRTE
jgi:hypothetical protein